MGRADKTSPNNQHLNKGVFMDEELKEAIEVIADFLLDVFKK